MLKTLPIFILISSFFSTGMPESHTIPVRLHQEYQSVEKIKLEVEITHIRNSKGSIRLGIFKSQESFEEENEYLAKSFSKSQVKDAKLRVDLYLPPGTYGIALLDDENDNGEMDYGLMLPEEGFGFSNYYHTGLSRPDFEDFSFDLNQSAKRLDIKVKYM